MSKRIPPDRWAELPPRVRDQIQLAARANRLAGDVTVTLALRCECGGWMRPGIDHECAGPGDADR